MSGLRPYRVIRRTGPRVVRVYQVHGLEREGPLLVEVFGCYTHEEGFAAVLSCLDSTLPAGGYVELLSETKVA